MKRASLTAARLIIATAALALGSAHAVVPYRVTDLGPGSASSINDNGQVLGSVSDLTESRNFVFTPGSGVTFLPQGFGAFGSSALNDAGLVAGAFHFPATRAAARRAVRPGPWFDRSGFAAARQRSKLGERCQQRRAGDRGSKNRHSLRPGIPLECGDRDGRPRRTGRQRSEPVQRRYSHQWRGAGDGVRRYRRWFGACVRRHSGLRHGRHPYAGSHRQERRQRDQRCGACHRRGHFHRAVLAARLPLQARDRHGGADAAWRPRSAEARESMRRITSSAK